MIFNSLTFLLFFVIFYTIYCVTQKLTVRRILILLGSYIFYAWWDWRFLSLIIYSTFIDYYIGLRLSQETEQDKRKRLLIVSIISNLGLLFVFKYFNFFTDSFYNLVQHVGLSPSPITLQIILPVGISFYTFQTMSYTIDIYRNKLQPEKNLLTFAGYVSFFPQLVAGPIVRASDLLPQFKIFQKITFDHVRIGLGLIALGYFKKIVIADSLAPLVDSGFAHPENYSSLHMIIIVIFYAFQIYCDFSGYSDIAIGLGKMLGFNFPKNFNLPYFSRNFSEFWQRWHITLSSWLRDYLYIPLGGNRNGFAMTQRNLMITMLLGGLWHGASWTFVLWGFLHGAYLIIQRICKPIIEKGSALFPRIIWTQLSIITTFSLVCLGWIFFRSQTLEQAITVITKISAVDNYSFDGLKHKFLIIKGIFILFIFIISELAYYKFKSKIDTLLSRHIYLGIIIMVIMILMILLLGTFGQSQFIYFQF